MKKIFAILSVTAILSVSCTKEFVTPSHNSSEPLDEYFNTEARMFESLVAAYDPLQWFDYFYQYDALHLVSDIMGDDINCGGSNEGDQPVLVKTHFFQLTPTDQPNTIWTIAYSGINRANTLIQYVDGVEGLAKATRDQWVAEALVLRSYYYNVLWKFWGNIPYYEENLKTPYFVDQLDHDTVYSNVIATLEEAIDMNSLPMKAAVGQEGRVTMAMAYMLFTEMVMYQCDQTRYQKALDYMKRIIDSNQYSLVDDFASIWTESGEWGPESIWEINYLSEGGVRAWDAPIAAGGNVFSILTGIPGAKAGSGFADGWGFGGVNESAYKMYDDTDIRRDGGILNWSDNRDNYAPRWEDTGYFLLKYIARESGNHGYKGADTMNYGNNIRVYRFSEALLNAAELAVLLGQDGSAWLKRVRERAKCQDTGVSRDDIIQERHKEFVGEGKRYWDLVRSGLAESVLKAANHPFRPAGNDWTPSKKYWPIPQSEMDKDDKLTQNNY
ncbi:MAG: RagB/SusD family nutrient uptake outer membrane protein [Bacteroidales bacterium]|nr:RagB/SusD family nutrient uptake outer membrane protein [Bacteroidales bacterium]